MQAVGQKNSILKLVIAEFPLCVRRSAQTSSYRCVRTFFSFFSAIAITHHQRKLQGNATAMRERGRVCQISGHLDSYGQGTNVGIASNTKLGFFWRTSVEKNLGYTKKLHQHLQLLNVIRLVSVVNHLDCYKIKSHFRDYAHL